MYQNRLFNAITLPLYGLFRHYCAKTSVNFSHIYEIFVKTSPTITHIPSSTPKICQGFPQFVGTAGDSITQYQSEPGVPVINWGEDVVRGVSPICRNGGRQYYPISIRARGSDKMGKPLMSEDGEGRRNWRSVVRYQRLDNHYFFFSPRLS